MFVWASLNNMKASDVFLQADTNEKSLQLSAQNRKKRRGKLGEVL